MYKILFKCYNKKTFVLITLKSLHDFTILNEMKNKDGILVKIGFSNVVKKEQLEKAF
jgi:hypothetical protein